MTTLLRFSTSPLTPDDGSSYASRAALALGAKLAADGGVDAATPSYSMVGQLYVSGEWGLLSVPNAMVRGVFDALHEPGIELPLQDGRLNAHISVFRPDELAMLGGAEAIRNDRGKPFRYSIGRLVEFEPAGWPGVERCWALRIFSKELQALRVSHGLSPLPAAGRYDFHVTAAVRKRGVSGKNDKSKGTAAA